MLKKHFLGFKSIQSNITRNNQSGSPLFLYKRRAADEHTPSAAVHSVHINLNIFQSTQSVFISAVT